MKSRDAAGLVISIAATLAVGYLASRVTIPEIPGWYAGLKKPSFNPPNWLFAPVWTTLYVLMAVAAWRVWRRQGFGWPISVYAVQLLLNGSWSFLFFGEHAVGAALAEITCLAGLIFITLVGFWHRDRIAGLLLLPYAAWVSFAGLLNLAIWHLNG